MNTYTTVLPKVAFAAVEAIAKIIPRTARRYSGLDSGAASTIVDSQSAGDTPPIKQKPQACDLGLWCAVRDSNPEPAG